MLQSVDLKYTSIGQVVHTLSVLKFGWLVVHEFMFYVVLKVRIGFED